MYVDYVTPGIVLIAVAGGAQSTAISVAMDINEGIITRFRTMGIARASVVIGHVLGSTIQTMVGLGGCPRCRDPGRLPTQRRP